MARMRTLELNAWTCRAAMSTASSGCAGEMDTGIVLDVWALELVDDVSGSGPRYLVHRAVACICEHGQVGFDG